MMQCLDLNDIAGDRGCSKYCVRGQVTTMCHLDRPMSLLGYLASQNRLFLVDKKFNVIGYTLPLILIEYKTLVMRGDLDKASEILPTIPKDQHNSVAHFLEARGMVEEALKIATDSQQPLSSDDEDDPFAGWSAAEFELNHERTSFWQAIELWNMLGCVSRNL